MNLEFFANEGGTLTTQDIQVQDGFELMKVEFDAPALAIERAHLLRRVKFLIKQSSYEDNSTGAKARSGYVQRDHAQNKLLG